MSIQAWDKAQAARAEGVGRIATGAVLTARAVASFAAFNAEAAYKETARAAQAFADGGALLATPLPELTRWERLVVWARSRWRRARSVSLGGGGPRSSSR